MSFPVTWLPPPSSYSLVGSEMYSIPQFSAFYSHLQVTSGQMTSLPGDFRSPEVTWGHSCHVTASPCELQPCRKWNVRYMPVFVPLQPLPGDFHSNDLTSGSLPGTRGQVTSFPVTWLTPPASYSLVGIEMYSIRQYSALYSHFQVTSVKWRHFRGASGPLRSRDVISRQVTTSHYELQPCRKWNVRYTPVFGILQPLPGTSGQMTSLPGQFRVPEDKWRRFL